MSIIVASGFKNKSSLPGGVRSIIAYIGRLRPKGVPFSRFRHTKRKGFHESKYMKGLGNVSFRYLKGPFIKIFHIRKQVNPMATSANPNPKFN